MAKAKKTDNKIYETIYVGNEPRCPKCEGGLAAETLGYDSAPESKRDFGNYEFISPCSECGARVRYWVDLGPRKRTERDENGRLIPLPTIQKPAVPEAKTTKVRKPKKKLGAAGAQSGVKGKNKTERKSLSNDEQPDHVLKPVRSRGSSAKKDSNAGKPAAVAAKKLPAAQNTAAGIAKKEPKAGQKVSARKASKPAAGAVSAADKRHSETKAPDAEKKKEKYRGITEPTHAEKKTKSRQLSFLEQDVPVVKEQKSRKPAPKNTNPETGRAAGKRQKPAPKSAVPGKATKTRKRKTASQ